MADCRDCVHYLKIEDGEHVMFCKNDGTEYCTLDIMGCTDFTPKKAEKVKVTCNNCEELHCPKCYPGNKEDKAYTTGQMIDMLLADKTLVAVCTTVCGLHVEFNDSFLCWLNEEKKYHANFRISSGNINTQWRIVEPKPKRTYKDVLLEKFPKVDVKGNGIPDICINRIFGKVAKCMTKTCPECWLDEYREDGGEG